MRDLFITMDTLLRDRGVFYARAGEGDRLQTLCLRLVVVFILTSAAYGLVMGSFRYFHPAYFFSDMQITLGPEGRTLPPRKVAGMDPERRRVYTEGLPPEAIAAEAGATVVFNVTDPSEPYPVRATGTEKGYAWIELADGRPLAEADAWTQPLWVMLKMPLLFLATLAVCALALYVLNLAFGLELRFLPTMALLLFGLAATGVMLGVFAPIALVFTAVTHSYHFIKVMHLVLVFVSGLFGAKVLAEGLARMAASGGTGRRLLLLGSWLLLYALVGSQLAWTLKPWMGTPYLPATPPFRIESGNIYVSAAGSVTAMGR